MYFNRISKLSTHFLISTKGHPIKLLKLLRNNYPSKNTTPRVSFGEAKKVVACSCLDRFREYYRIDSLWTNTTEERDEGKRRKIESLSRGEFYRWSCTGSMREATLIVTTFPPCQTLKREDHGRCSVSNVVSGISGDTQARWCSYFLVRLAAVTRMTRYHGAGITLHYVGQRCPRFPTSGRINHHANTREISSDCFAFAVKVE